MSDPTRPRKTALSGIERRLCDLLLEQPDRTDRELGQILGLSDKTVKNYMSGIYRWFGVGGRTSLAVKLSQIEFGPARHRFCPSCGRPYEGET